MYNGIGLQTARGSGTNGYVQSNRFFIKPRLSKVITDSSLKGFGSGEGTAGLTRKPNREILEHDRKRQIQLKLLVLEEKLKDKGYTEEEMKERMEERRRRFEVEKEANSLEDGEIGTNSLTHSKISDTQTHQIAARKERQMETLRAALGIGAETQKNKRYAMVQSDSEDIDNDDDEPANNHKKEGNIKKSLKGIVDNDSELRNVKKSYGKESVEDIHHDSALHKKQKSGRGRRGDSSDSDDSKEKVVIKDKKKLRRKTTGSDSDDEDYDVDVKRKKKTSLKARSRRRKHDTESSDDSSDSGSGSDVDVKKKKKNSLKSRSKRRKHDTSSDSGSESDSSSDSGSDDELEMKSHKDSYRQSDRDLNDRRRRTGKEHVRSDDEKAQHGRDSDGLDTLKKLEKLYKPKEEKIVKADHVSNEPNRSKRKTDDGNRDEQPDRKSRRRDISDDEVKHSRGSKDRGENRITDRWGAEPVRDYDVARRESSEDKEIHGRKHRRDEEEDTHRIIDRGAERQPERNRREQDHKSSKNDRDGDRDSTKRARYDDSPKRARYDDSPKRARYDDSRSAGRRYHEDDDRHGRKSSDGRHDDRRSRH